MCAIEGTHRHGTHTDNMFLISTVKSRLFCPARSLSVWKRGGRKKAGKEKMGEVGKRNKSGKKKTRERNEMEGEKEGRRRDGGRTTSLSYMFYQNTRKLSH